jgi:hypothetical protein
MQLDENSGGSHIEGRTPPPGQHISREYLRAAAAAARELGPSLIDREGFVVGLTGDIAARLGVSFGSSSGASTRG